MAIAGMFNDQPWAGDAVCAQTDPDAFYPEKGGSSLAAKRTCLACPVRRQCLEWALFYDEKWGVWGGLSERERRAWKKRLTTAAPTDDDDEAAA